MKITRSLSDQAVCIKISRRLAQHRLNQNITQAVLAREAGISLHTMIQVECAESVQAPSLIRILRVLKFADNLDFLFPEPTAGPIQRITMQGKR